MANNSDLFGQDQKKPRREAPSDAPLSLRMRPRGLDDFIGQEHVLAKDKLLRRLIDSDRISSLIIYGPPGTGKSALAYIISDLTNSEFVSVNATLSGVQEVKKIILEAKRVKSLTNRRTILFIDEIHRFSKSQQDVLIADVELGTVILIGATTYNPFFYIIPALISRSHVFEFKPHTQESLLKILNRAIQDKDKGLGKYDIIADPRALEQICRFSDGDARRLLNALEVGVLTTAPDKDNKIQLTLQVAEESIQKKIVRYDRGEDDHYDTISAFIKSMRGSDPDAALYWLAKMLYAGEDPRFVARRIVICASEDVGNAEPQALVVATAAFNAVEFLGMPEARIPLAQAAVFVACAPKSNAAYLGLESASADVANNPQEEVPAHLKDASYKGAEKLDRGKDYKYAHDFKDHYVNQQYKQTKKIYYFPTELGYEKKIKQWLEYLKAKQPDTSNP